MTTDTHLLEPGSAQGYAVAGDPAVLAALVRAELVWVQVLAAAGRAPAGLAGSISDSLAVSPVDLAQISARSADGGNPVIPLVEDLRARAGDDGRWVHSGLTSQDVVDTGVMLVVRDALDAVERSLVTVGDALAGLAESHRDSVMAGRTLTQHAVPITFGLKAAQWLAAVQEVLVEVQACRDGLPVQCGGAAGTLASFGVVVPESAPSDLAEAWAEGLGLVWPGAPWHTRRRPVTRIGDVLAAVVSALGHLGSDVATMARPELGELSEGAAGGSSTMLHKHNPVRSVLLRSSAIQAGPLAGLLHQCSALAVDERSDGAWHAEWPTLQRLLVLAVTAAGTAASLVGELQVHAAAMAARATAATDALLSERGGLARRTGRTTTEGTTTDATEDTDIRSYLGSAGALTDAAVERWKGRTAS